VAVADSIEEGEGEGYFASASDLMAGILFVFLLMLIVFALNFRDAEHDQQVEYARYREAQQRAEAAEMATREAKEQAIREAALATAQQIENDRLRQLLKDAVAQLERDIADRTEARDRMLALLQKSLKIRDINVIVDRTSGILRLPEGILFNLGESAIEKEKLPTLQTLADVLSQVLPCYAYVENRANCDGNASPILETVLVEGHTDRQGYAQRRLVPRIVQSGQSAGGLGDRQESSRLSPAESQAKNDRLSTERALNVFKELLQAKPSLIDLLNPVQVPLLGVSGYGERRPLPDAKGTSQEDYKRNRRIDLRFVLSARTSDEITRLRDKIRETLERAR